MGWLSCLDSHCCRIICWNCQYLSNKIISVSVILTKTQVCTSFPPTKPFFARYIPRLLSANSQYIRTHSHREQSPQPPSSKIIKVERTFGVNSHDREASAGLEFEEFSGRDDKREKSDQVQQRCDISQDWSWINLPASPPTSVVQPTLGV